MQTEKCKDPDKQSCHQHPNDVDAEVIGRVCGIVVRIEAEEVGVYRAVTFAAGIGKVVGMHARTGIVRRQVLVRRMAVDADSTLRHAETRRLAVECIPKRRQVFLVTVCADIRATETRVRECGVDDRVGFMALRADRAVLPGHPRQAVRGLRLPFLEQQLVTLRTGLRSMLVGYR